MPSHAARTLLVLLALSASCMVTWSPPAVAETNGLDANWGRNGMLRLPVLSGFTAQAGAVERVGTTTYVGIEHQDLLGGGKPPVSEVVALEGAGSLVTSFGDAGRLKVPDELNPYEVLDDLAADGRGGLLIRGREGDQRSTVRRVDLVTGRFDPAFGDGGAVRVNTFLPNYDTNLAVDSQGRFYLPVRNMYEADPGVRRFTPAGKPDPTFGSDGGQPGRRNIVVPSGWSGFMSLVVDTADRVLLSSWTTRPDDTDTDSVVRFLPDGTLEISFDGGGGGLHAFTRPLLAPSATGFVVAEPADDACGIAVHRYDGEGVPDPAFGDAGISVVPIEPEADGECRKWLWELETDDAGRPTVKFKDGYVRLDRDGAVDDYQPLMLDSTQGVRFGALNVAPDGTRLMGGCVDCLGYIDGTAVVATVVDDLAARAGTRFTALTPTRLLDTREGLGAPQARLSPQASLRLKVAGVGGVPADAAAVVLNVTAVQASGDGYVSVWPSGGPRPTVSNLNVRPGMTRPNAVTVKVGQGGAVDIFNQAGSLDVVVDVAGYYSRTSGVAFTPLAAPKRILDTRDGLGAPAARATAAAPVLLQVTGPVAGVPSSATAVIMNLTAVQPTNATHVTVWPGGTTRPTASNLNLEAGEIAPNLVTVKLGTGGTVALAPGAGAVHLVVDVAGWYGVDGKTLFVPVEPTRLLDTREEAVVKQGETIEAVVETGGVPPYAAAVSLNLTAVLPSALSHVIAYPTGQARPLTSNLNLTAGVTVPNLAVVGVGDAGSIHLYNNQGATHLLADVAGYFTD